MPVVINVCATWCGRMEVVIIIIIIIIIIISCAYMLSSTIVSNEILNIYIYIQVIHNINKNHRSWPEDGRIAAETCSQ